MRRGSVSAESIAPSLRSSHLSMQASSGSATTAAQDTQVKIPKDAATREIIDAAIRGNFLFRELEDDQRQEIIDAMFRVDVPTGHQVIVQGDDGDNFYIVQSGCFDILVSSKKVAQVGVGATFGELALMYNTPRSATVQACSPGILWAVDRLTFRTTLMDNIVRKRQMYTGFLAGVPLFATLSADEVSRIADALEPVAFAPDAMVIRQGSTGDKFYLILDGQAKVYVNQEGSQSIGSSQYESQSVESESSGQQQESSGQKECSSNGQQQEGSGQQQEGNGFGQLVSTLQKGDYFGEIALINNVSRAATVIAGSSGLRCVSLERSAFVRLLGPVIDILKRNMTAYQKYRQFLETD